MSPSNIGGQILSPRAVAPTVLQIRKGPMLDDPVVSAAVPVSGPRTNPARSHTLLAPDQRHGQEQPPGWRLSLQLAELYLHRQKYEAGLAVLKPILLHHASEADIHCLHGKLLASIDNKAGVRLQCACCLQYPACS